MRVAPFTVAAERRAIAERVMISVCICTYNRSQGLRRTLDSLAGQRGIDLGTVEVLVVDNNCTDDTPTWWKSSGKFADPSG